MATIADNFHWFVSDSMSDLKAYANLNDLSVSYGNCIADNNARIRHHVYYETEGIFGKKVVELVSANPGITGVRPVGIGRDHMEICKPPNRKDQVYERVLAFLEDEVLVPRFTGDTIVQGMTSDITAKIGETYERVAQLPKAPQEGIAPPDAAEEHPVFQAARQKAEARWSVGRTGNASQAFMDALEHQDRVENQRREDHRRLCVQLLEEAVFYDVKANNSDAAFQTLRLVAERRHPEDRNAQKDYLRLRASQYHEQGTLMGDNTALLVEIKILNWLLA